MSDKTTMKSLRGDEIFRDAIISQCGNYRNTLLSWRGQQLSRLCKLMARYAAMEKQGHPDLRDQGYLIEITQETIRAYDRSLVSLGDAP